jgi:myo-inositol-1(or 4)-monophosphatase
MEAQFLEVAKKAALFAGEWTQAYFGTKTDQHYKEGEELVTPVDVLAENLVKIVIHRVFPEHSILGEESGLEKRTSDYLWICDCLDGTVNYSRGIPLYGVSVAVAHEKEVLAGVVYNPITNELFSAGKGTGAFLDKGKNLVEHSLIRVSDLSDLSKSLIYMTELYKTRKYIDRLIDLVPKLRVNSASAYESCLVADGRIDGFIKVTSHPWGYAAAFRIVEEAGGVVTNFDGSPWNIESTHMVAANPIIHKKILKNLTL